MLESLRYFYWEIVKVELREGWIKLRHGKLIPEKQSRADFDRK
jgi:hypothetical protein